MSKQGIASIGMKVTVNKTEMNYVQEIGDIGWDALRAGRYLPQGHHEEERPGRPGHQVL